MFKLRPEDLEVMFAHARREFPNECCGVILGALGDYSKNEVRPCANIQHQLKEKYPELYTRDADTGYFMDPKDLKHAFEDAMKNGKTVIGFYHSHPGHEAYWSGEDHRAAMWAGSDEPSFPDASHVVISVYEDGVKGHAVFSWSPAEGRFARK
ncbi:MAG: M67 family metallopeptidase [Nitrospinae bacterium]|nr:M67 family metallopeptidase [Nitrospinota bacterium]